MSVDLLRQFLHGNQDDYADFLRRFQQDPSSISGAEAARRYRELMTNLPPEAAAQVHSQVLAQLSPDDRRQIAQQLQRAHNDPNSAFDGFNARNIDQASHPQTLGAMTQQAGAQDSSLLDQILGPGSPLSGQLGKMLMAGLAAYLASRMLGNNQSGYQGAPAGSLGGAGQSNPWGDILGGLLGGQAGAQAGQSGPQGGQSNPLGDILGGLLGGQGGQSNPLGDILGGLLGGQGGLGAGGAGGVLGGQSSPNSGAQDTPAEEPQPPKDSHRKYS